ncbi:MAG TPA: hypothetical protein VGH99_06205 [Pseudonocardia sp.]
MAAYEPGRHVLFRFRRPTPLEGTHDLEVLPGRRPGTALPGRRPGTAVLRHTLVGRPLGLTGLLGWPLVIRWLHDAVIEELLDRAGDAVGDPPARRTRWSPWVRLGRLLLGARRDHPRPVGAR